MLDDRARRHLAEMGIDTYVRRGTGIVALDQPDDPRPDHPSYPGEITRATRREVHATIAIVADKQSPDAAIIDDLRRALRMAGAHVVAAESVSGAQPGITFQASVDAADAANTLVAGPVAALRGDAQRKRALWRGAAALLRRASSPEGVDSEPSD